MCVSFFWHFVFGKVINSKDLKQLERREMFAHYKYCIEKFEYYNVNGISLLVNTMRKFQKIFY